jgi:DNA-binding NtrC family response regulator
MGVVLIVDDEQPLRELLSRWLTGHHVVHEAENAEAALAVLASEPVGVALCDRSMPGHDGFWLIEQIRKHHPAVAIILATADDAIPPRISLQNGIVGYLVKPFKAPLVLSAVDDALVWHQTAHNQQKSKDGEPNPIGTWLRGPTGRKQPNDDQ